MLPSMRRLDSEHAWIFDRWISPQTIVFFYWFFNHQKILKQVLFFFTDGKKTDGAHTRSVRPMKTVHWSIFIGQINRVYRALVFTRMFQKGAAGLCDK